MWCSKPKASLISGNIRFANRIYKCVSDVTQTNRPHLHRSCSMSEITSIASKLAKKQHWLAWFSELATEVRFTKCLPQHQITFKLRYRNVIILGLHTHSNWCRFVSGYIPLNVSHTNYTWRSMFRFIHRKLFELMTCKKRIHSLTLTHSHSFISSLFYIEPSWIGVSSNVST